MKKLTLLLVGALALSHMSFAQVGFEAGKTPQLKRLNYSKINPKIETATEGMISNDAIYYLWLFGKKAKNHMWVILDKSSERMKNYDKIYIDRDCDGIIGENGERFDLKKDILDYQLEIKDWKNPSTGKASKLKIHSAVFEKSGKTIVLWAQLIINGYKTSFLTENNKPNSPKTASKTWIGFEKPLVFTTKSYPHNNTFYLGTGELKGGPYGWTFSANERSYVLGYIGTNNSLWYVDLSFLPKEESLIAKVIYKDKNGKKKVKISKLEERC